MSVPTKVVSSLMRLGADVVDGDLSTADQVARRLVGLGLELVPVDELRKHLDAEAAARIDAEVDAYVDAVKGPK